MQYYLGIGFSPNRIQRFRESSKVTLAAPLRWPTHVVLQYFDPSTTSFLTFILKSYSDSWYESWIVLMPFLERVPGAIKTLLLWFNISKRIATTVCDITTNLYSHGKLHSNGQCSVLYVWLVSGRSFRHTLSRNWIMQWVVKRINIPVLLRTWIDPPKPAKVEALGPSSMSFASLCNVCGKPSIYYHLSFLLWEYYVKVMGSK